MSLDAATIKQLIESRIPAAKVHIKDIRGDQLYFQISIIASFFKDYTALEQQRLVHQALATDAESEFPVLEIRTAVSAVMNKKRS